MSKLYPPTIDGSLTATYEGATYVVPYILNKAVSADEVKGFAVKVKTIQSNLNVCYVESEDFNESEVKFKLPNDSFLIGQSYKLQLACIDTEDIIGYYSTVGVFKYTCKPEAYFENISLVNENGDISINPYTYVAKYVNADITEKPYLYQFDLLDYNKNIIETSGELFAGTYTLTTSLKDYHSYYMRLAITTINGLKAQSVDYRIIEAPLAKLSLDDKVSLTTALDSDNGGIKINFNAVNDLTGNFRLLRSEDQVQWNEMCRFTLPGMTTWEDLTVESGKQYYYCLQQYGKSKYSRKTTPVKSPIAVLDYAYLYDGERQLRISYNAKVATFKDTILTTKIDTIGGKYPYIFRNGNVQYKEMSLSGLISVLTDENYLFLPGNAKSIEARRKTDSKSTDDPSLSTHLTAENFNIERDFKLEVLEWLNNGKVKLFRSAAEGSYLVRLINVSLSPMDVLGRMLHTFIATAYEIADFSYPDLCANQIIRLTEPDSKVKRQVIYRIREDDAEKGNLLQSAECSNVKLYDFPSGTIIKINNDSIEIGSSGSFTINTDIVDTLEIVYYKPSADHQPAIEYECYSNIANEALDNVAPLYVRDYPYVCLTENSNPLDTSKIYKIYYCEVIDNATNAVIGKYNYITDENQLLTGEGLITTEDNYLKVVDGKTVILSYYGEV